MNEPYGSQKRWRALISRNFGGCSKYIRLLLTAAVVGWALVAVQPEASAQPITLTVGQSAEVPVEFEVEDCTSTNNAVLFCGNKDSAETVHVLCLSPGFANFAAHESALFSPRVSVGFVQCNALSTTIAAEETRTFAPAGKAGGTFDNELESCSSSAPAVATCEVSHDSFDKVTITGVARGAATITVNFSTEAAYGPLIFTVNVP